MNRIRAAAHKNGHVRAPSPDVDEIPYDEDAEVAVIGAVLLDGENAFAKVRGRLGVEDFYGDAARRVFAAAFNRFLGGSGVDVGLAILLILGDGE